MKGDEALLRALDQNSYIDIINLKLKLSSMLSERENVWLRENRAKRNVLVSASVGGVLVGTLAVCQHGSMLGLLLSALSGVVMFGLIGLSILLHQSHAYALKTSCAFVEQVMSGPFSTLPANTLTQLLEVERVHAWYDELGVEVRDTLDGLLADNADMTVGDLLIISRNI